MISAGGVCCPLTSAVEFGQSKWIILPRLSNLCSALQVEVPPKQFREWDKHFSKLIWNNKWPRVRCSTLQQPGERGGMALPCLKDYYLSAQLRYLVRWCNPAYEARWKDIELSSMETPIQSALGCPGRFNAVTSYIIIVLVSLRKCGQT